MMRQMSRFSIVPILVLSVVCGAATANSNDRVETKVIMAGIYKNISDLLPLSMNDREFYKTENSGRIQAEMNELAKYADRLSEHTATSMKALKFVSHSLEQDARDMAKWFSQGRRDEARYMLHNITENCISCHLKQKSDTQFPGVSGLFAKVDIKQMNPVERARLEIATRQFDAALATFEKLFDDSSTKPSDLMFLDVFADYLKVAIRVERDIPRARKTFARFLKREDLPQFVRKQVGDWEASLQELEKEKLTADIGTARRLVNKAQGVMQFPRDRDGMVYFIAASGILNEIADSGIKSKEDLAEVYYRLGFIEEVIGRSFWVSETEAMLESAIRTAPRSNFAREAYALLEEYVYMDYSGSSGTHVPDEVEANLKELRKLIK